MDSSSNILISNFKHTDKSKILIIILIQIELYSHGLQNITRMPYGNFHTIPQGINCLTPTGFFNAF